MQIEDRNKTAKSIKMINYKWMLFFLVTIGTSSCKSFMHGLTWKKALNTYWPVTGNKSNFGDRRLEYNKAFHRNSALAAFLDCKCHDRGLPDFIYEYQSVSKARGIKLIYTTRDSVFVFEEPKKNNLNTILIESRSLEKAEKLEIEKINTGKQPERAYP